MVTLSAVVQQPTFGPNLPKYFIEAEKASQTLERSTFPLVLQIQELEKSREELSQLKTDLQENVELVSFGDLWSRV